MFQSLSNDKQLSEAIYLFLLRTDLTDNVHGVHSGPQPEEVRERLQSLNLVEDQCQPDVNGVPEEELEETSVGRILLTNLSENLAEAASQATSTFSEFIGECKTISMNN